MVVVKGLLITLELGRTGSVKEAEVEKPNAMMDCR